ncbi:S-adenosyl-L-methionine-dependent methyltransferase [Aspergillus heterothallicus]
MLTTNRTNTTYQDADAFMESIQRADRSLFAVKKDYIKVLRAAYALVSWLETPWDIMARLCLTKPALSLCLKHKIGEDAVCLAKDLAHYMGCNKFLLRRILKHLVATNLISEPSPGSFQQSIYHATIPCFYRAPEFLAKTGYQNPIDPSDGIFQYTEGFKVKVFNNMMGGVMAEQAGMLDIFPFERLDDGRPGDSTTALLVDVGGNVGHDINKFLSQHPEHAPRLVLQDRSDVISLAKCPSTVQMLVHDFFTPQPIKGARTYYLHSVIHDWADPPARTILGHLRDAMTVGYSKLLVHDHVLPDRDPRPQATAYDLTMMVKVSAFERTEQMWVKLLGSVGFRVVKTWSSPLATQSVIEAEAR